MRMEPLLKPYRKQSRNYFLSHTFKEKSLNRGVLGLILVSLVADSLALENKMVVWTVPSICLIWLIHLGVSGSALIPMLVL